MSFPRKRESISLWVYFNPLCPPLLGDEETGDTPDPPAEKSLCTLFFDHCFGPPFVKGASGISDYFVHLAAWPRMAREMIMRCISLVPPKSV